MTPSNLALPVINPNMIVTTPNDIKMHNAEGIALSLILYTVAAGSLDRLTINLGSKTSKA